MLVGYGMSNTPIKGKALAWEGEGDVPSWGVGLSQYWFVNDRYALGVGATLLEFDTDEEWVTGGELRLMTRYYFAERDNVGFFFDFNVGSVFTEEPIPPPGTTENYTFAFGPGFEIPISERFTFLCGATFHHMSNARGKDTPKNPSLNESRLWLGFGFNW